MDKMARYREWDLQCKVYVGNLGSSASKHEIESAFGKYGPLRNVWVARNPPGFAFVEFEDKRDAEDAVRSLDGTRCCGTRIRVEMSSGRSRRDDRTRRPRRSYRANSSMILHDSNNFRHSTSCLNFASSATSAKTTTATTTTTTTTINSTNFTTTITSITTKYTTKTTSTITTATGTSRYCYWLMFLKHIAIAQLCFGGVSVIVVVVSSGALLSSPLRPLLFVPLAVAAGGRLLRLDGAPFCDGLQQRQQRPPSHSTASSCAVCLLFLFFYYCYHHYYYYYHHHHHHQYYYHRYYRYYFCHRNKYCLTRTFVLQRAATDSAAASAIQQQRYSSLLPWTVFVPS
ncbi:hypothetical protein AND_004909 [Anopheles darlingi]|uniref:RRM domain-containing protein n=1 Tax=Anopheles darlingi TaxID=43151 RepID=W5JG60_ANODA|nr:hypothetical protein AND_004909 [Anopheles darlingi]